jgi:hypothetical protein
MFDDLNDDNFLLYAMKYYNNPQCLSEKDFHDDLKILKYIKRLINRYLITGDLKDRLILNHLIMMGNIFPIFAAVRILFYKMPENSWPVLKTFLIYLNYMPKFVEKINGKSIYTDDIEVDLKVVKILREI